MLEKKLEKLINSNAPKSIADLSEQIAEQILLKAEKGKEKMEQYLFLDLESVLGEKGIYSLRRHLDIARRKAMEPLKVAMVGDFSSGKTTSLMALVKHEGVRLLPKDLARPTTGNICEIHLHYDTDEASYPMTDICLFSIDQIREMLDDYLDELCRNPHLNSKLNEFRGSTLEKIDQLINRCQTLLRENNSKIRDLGIKEFNNLIEFFRLTNSIKYFQRQYGSFDIKERSLHILKSHHGHDRFLKKLLQIDLQGRNSSLELSMVEQKIEDSWSKVPTTWEGFEEQCQQGTIKDEAFEAIFLLINRIKVHIFVSGNNFNSNNSICYLDFPGVGSGGFRDKWLCRREVAAAHASLLFIKVDRLASESLHDLRDIIVAEKNDVAKERIIPILNFFDGHRPLPDNTSEEEDPMSLEHMLSRIRFFFNQDNKGFIDVLTKLNDLRLSIKPDENYYLLTAIAGLPENWWSQDEVQLINNYLETIAPRYRWLRDALNTVLTQRAKLGISQEDQILYRKLNRALSGYLPDGKVDGGLQYLRDGLDRILKEKGARMICEDAVRELRKAMIPLNADLIEPLRETLTMESPDVESVDKKLKREKIRLKWNAIGDVVSELTRQQKVFDLKLKHQKRENGLNEVKWISLLEEIQPYSLEKVSLLAFWKKAMSHESNLQELNKDYNILINEIDQWLASKVQDSIQQTLEFLEIETISKDGDEISLSGIRGYFQELLHNNINQIEEEEKVMLENLLNLKTLGADLPETVMTEFNKRAHSFSPIPPFNAKGATTGASVEIMKLQRQMAQTVKFRLSESVLILNEIFTRHFKNALTRQFDSNIDNFTPMALPQLLLDKLVDLTPDDPVAASEYADRMYATNLAMEIVSIWDEYINR